MAVVSESITIATIAGAMIAVMPVETFVVIAYFAVAALVFTRSIKPRAVAAGEVQLEASRMSEWAGLGFGATQEIKIRHAQITTSRASPTGPRRGPRPDGWPVPDRAPQVPARTALHPRPRHPHRLGHPAGGAGSLLGRSPSSAAAFRILAAADATAGVHHHGPRGESAREFLYAELDREDETLTQPALTSERLLRAHPGAA